MWSWSPMQGQPASQAAVGTPTVVSPLPGAIVTDLEVQLCHHVCFQVCGFSVTLVYNLL